MKIRGFFIKHRVVSLFRRLHQSSSPTGYHRLHRRKFPQSSPTAVSKLLKWGNLLKTKAISMCSANSGESVKPGVKRFAAVPKGKMAVYVGQKDGDFKRVLVPVIYINHPLFGQLLRDAEEEYGHDHPGGITIPCRFSDFESVKRRVAAVCGCRKLLAWQRR